MAPPQRRARATTVATALALLCTSNLSAAQTGGVQWQGEQGRPMPPSPSPPTPRRCVDKGPANLRFSANSTSAGGRQWDVFHISERYLWEGSSGNWATEALPIEWNPDSESRNATVYWSKAVYDASVNRTFLIRGNMTEDGAVGPATFCHSEPGSDFNLVGMHPTAGTSFSLWTPMFGCQNNECIGDGGCVGEGGIWPTKLGQTRVGRAVHAVYAFEFADSAAAPSSANEAVKIELIVDELDDAEHFIPISFAADTLNPWGQDTRIAWTGIYTDFDSSDVPFPASEWDIPAVCYTAAASARREHARQPEASAHKWWWQPL